MFKAWFGGYEHFYHIGAARANELTLVERLAYSVLIHFAKFPSVRRSCREIARLSGLDPRTAGKAVSRLEEVGLCTSDLVSLPPPDGWYTKVKTPVKDGWEWSYASYPVLVPREGCDFTPGQIALLGLIYSHCGDKPYYKGLTRVYLASLLGNNQKTVAADLDRLVVDKLITVHQGKRFKDTFAVGLYAPSAEVLGQFIQVGTGDEEEFEGFDFDQFEGRDIAVVGRQWPEEHDHWARYIINADPDNPDAVKCVKECVHILNELGKYVNRENLEDFVHRRVQECARDHVPYGSLRHGGHLFKKDILAILMRKKRQEKDSKDWDTTNAQQKQEIAAACAEAGYTVASESGFTRDYYPKPCTCPASRLIFQWREAGQYQLPQALATSLGKLRGVSVESTHQIYECRNWRCKARGNVKFVKIKATHTEQYLWIDYVCEPSIIVPTVEATDTSAATATATRTRDTTT